MDFLELLETMRAEDASVARIFGGEGQAVRRLTRRDAPEYQRGLLEATRLIAGVVSGQRPIHHLREAMTTSDFPLYTADVLDRAILGAYSAFPRIWPQYLGRRTVRDFRTAKLFAFDGGEAYLTEIIPEMTEYPSAALSETQYTLRVYKHGRRIPFSWEMFLADDLDMLSSIPARLGTAAARTEDRIATALYVGTTGPDSTFFSAGHANVVTANPALSTAGLQLALTLLGSQTDVDGEPILFDGYSLVVPPALGLTADVIINATEYRLVVSGNTTIVKGNGLGSNLKVVVNPYIGKIATSNQTTSWFVFGNPIDGRPAATMAFLRGYEQPQVFMKEPNQRRIGGATNPFDGDFATDAIEYKLRHAVGASLLEYRAAVASNGTGA